MLAHAERDALAAQLAREAKEKFRTAYAEFLPVVEALGLDPYRGDNPITVREAEVLLREYLKEQEGTNGVVGEREKYFNYIILHTMRNEGTTGDAIDFIVKPLLALWYEEGFIPGVTGYKGFDIIGSGLRNPQCPADVLSYACYHACWHYAWTAHQHSNCPEEDSVAVWLRWSDVQARN